MQVLGFRFGRNIILRILNILKVLQQVCKIYTFFNINHSVHVIYQTRI